RARARTPAHRADLRPPRGAQRPARRDRRLHRGDDRQVRARIRGDDRVVPRIKDSSVEAVKQAADIVAIVEARTRLRKIGGRYTRRWPVPEDNTASISLA